MHWKHNAIKLHKIQLKSLNGKVCQLILCHWCWLKSRLWFLLRYFIIKGDFFSFRNILRLDILKFLVWKHLWKKTPTCKFCSRKESPYEISFRCVKVNDIIQHEKKKKRTAAKVFKSRQASNGGKQKALNEVWGLGFFVSSCVFQVPTSAEHVTSIFSALNRRQIERRWNTATRVHLSYVIICCSSI